MAMGNDQGIYSPMSLGTTLEQKMAMATGFMPGQDPQESMAAGLMKTMPGVITTTGWNIGRASNTIIKGGTQNRWYRKALHRGDDVYHGVEGGMFKHGFMQNVAHLGRYSRPAEVSGVNGVYTPMNVLADLGNKAFGRHKNIMDKVLGSDRVGKLQNAMGGAEKPEGVEYFSSGVLGRLSASGKIMKLNPNKRRYAKQLENIYGSIKDMNPTYGEHFLGASKAFHAAGATSEQWQAFHSFGVVGTIDSKYSGHLAGRFAGYQARYMEKEGAQGIIEAGRVALKEGTFARAGFNAAIEGTEKGMGVMSRFIGSGAASSVLKGFSTASYIMLAHDVAKAAGKVIGAGIREMGEAGTSLIGSINKPVMGMGFKDNSVAQTARSRGVMAIQNSRLNARSVLGSEAGAMYAHFG